MKLINKIKKVYFGIFKILKFSIYKLSNENLEFCTIEIIHLEFISTLSIIKLLNK